MCPPKKLEKKHDPKLLKMYSKYIFLWKTPSLPPPFFDGFLYSVLNVKVLLTGRCVHQENALVRVFSVIEIKLY